MLGTERPHVVPGAASGATRAAGHAARLAVRRSPLLLPAGQTVALCRVATSGGQAAGCCSQRLLSSAQPLSRTRGAAKRSSVRTAAGKANDGAGQEVDAKVGQEICEAKRAGSVCGQGAAAWQFPAPGLIPFSYLRWPPQVMATDVRTAAGSGETR